MPCLVQCLKSVTRRRNGGAEIARTDIARPDKTAPDQTARLNNVYSRLQCLRAVSHSVGAHTACLQLRDDDSSSSSENEDEDQQEPVPVATTSTTSDSTTAAEAIQRQTTVVKFVLWRHVVVSHWCRADMRVSAKHVLCVCLLWKGMSGVLL